MSAFICDPKLFMRLAGFAACPRGNCTGVNVNPRYVRNEHIKRLAEPTDTAPLADCYANILYNENIRSVMQRYPNCSVDELPGPLDAPISIEVPKEYVVNPTPQTIGQLMKDCDCLDYQSCETDDWEQTPAFALLAAIRNELCRYVPGYEGAKWGGA